jgi:GNAT superfamily N-acetyltransferase
VRRHPVEANAEPWIRWDTLRVLDVERLDTASWARLSRLRLRALDDTPEAFGSSADAERHHGERAWRRLAGLGPWWLAVGDGLDVGLVAGGHRDGHAASRWVYSMWVDPAWRGRGVAAALLDAVVGWAVDEGAARLGLDVTDRVPRARRFYERHGFKATGVVEPLPRDPSILLAEMVLDLTAPSPRPRTTS